MKRVRLFDVADLVLAGNTFFKENDLHYSLSMNIDANNYMVFVHDLDCDDPDKAMTMYTTFEKTEYEYDPDFIKAESHIRRLMHE